MKPRWRSIRGEAARLRGGREGTPEAVSKFPDCRPPTPEFASFISKSRSSAGNRNQWLFLVMTNQSKTWKQDGCAVSPGVEGCQGLDPLRWIYSGPSFTPFSHLPLQVSLGDGVYKGIRDTQGSPGGPGRRTELKGGLRFQEFANRVRGLLAFCARWLSFGGDSPS